MTERMSERPLKKLATSRQRLDGTPVMPARKSALSLSRQRLIELMQRLGFGLIQNLHIQGGEPIFDGNTKVSRDIRIGDRSAHRELEGQDFLLRREVVALFALFTENQDGVIELLEIKHGLPFRIVAEEPKR
jgi:hypothetical protein